MRLNINSLKSRMLLVSSLCLTLPVVGMVIISYGYWDKRQQEEQFLQQQHALNFCIQDLENSIFYSRVSELSNLSIIRNELFRLYRIVDLSAQYTRVADLNLSASHARSALIAPSPSPRAMSVAANDENDNATVAPAPSRLERDDRSSRPLNDAAGEPGQGTTINRNTGRVDSPYITDLKETVALLDGTTGASIISALDKAHSGDLGYQEQYGGSDVTIPMPLDGVYKDNENTTFAEALNAAHDMAADPSRFISLNGDRVDAISQGGSATIGAAPFKKPLSPDYHGQEYTQDGPASSEPQTDMGSRKGQNGSASSAQSAPAGATAQSDAESDEQTATSSELYLESLAHSMETGGKDNDTDSAMQPDTQASKDAAAAADSPEGQAGHAGQDNAAARRDDAGSLVDAARRGSSADSAAEAAEAEDEGGNIVKLDPLFDRSLIEERQRQLYGDHPDDEAAAGETKADMTDGSDAADALEQAVQKVIRAEAGEAAATDAGAGTGSAGADAGAGGAAAGLDESAQAAAAAAAQGEAISEKYGIIYSPIPKLTHDNVSGYTAPAGSGIHGSARIMGDAIRAPDRDDVAAAAAAVAAAANGAPVEDDSSLSIRRPVVNNGLDRYRDFFINPATDPNESFLIGAESPDFNNNRIKLQSHLTQLNKLGFIAFSINTRNPDQDIFIKNRDRLLLDDLANDDRRLSSILYNNNHADHSFFVILKSVKKNDDDESQVSPSMYNRLSGEYNDDGQQIDGLTSDGDSFISAGMGHPVTADNIVGLDSDGTVIEGGTVVSDSQSMARHYQGDGHDHSFSDDPRFNHDIQERNLRYSSAATIAAERDYLKQGDTSGFRRNTDAENDAIATGANKNEGVSVGTRQVHRRSAPPPAPERAYLAIVAPLSLSANQLIVIITDISKLRQQEETLKRLISNSLNETVLSNSITSPFNITLIDSELNPLAGTIKNREEVVALLDEDLILEARLRGSVQFYDPNSGQYASLGAFKHYNWFVLINSDNSHMAAQLYWFMALVGVSGLIFALIVIFVLVRTAGRDADDIKLINNKIKHLATLLQDPVLLQRICDSLPKRDDEIGSLSSHIRLMAKTVYQSIQEILQINKARDLEESEKHYIDQLRHSAVNREIFLKESFSNILNVHTESAYQGASDFYDVFELGEHRVAIFVGSINDAGALSTNIALINIALIRQLIRLSESIRLPLGRAMQELNDNIADNNPKSIMTSVCIIIVDQRNGNVEYFNAGHNLPIIYKKEQGFDYIDCRTAPVMGASTTASFKSMTFRLDEGDSILLYTDGVMDCQNFKGDPLDQLGFENMLHDESFINPVETVNSLTSKLKRFTKDRKQTKDYTLLCYQYNKESPAETKERAS